MHLLEASTGMAYSAIFGAAFARLFDSFGVIFINPRPLLDIVCAKVSGLFKDCVYNFFDVTVINKGGCPRILLQRFQRFRSRVSIGNTKF